MTTFLYSHPVCLEHETGAGHPESSERLRALLDRLGEPAFEALERRTAPRAEWGQISRIHEPTYMSRVFATVPREGEAWISPDVIVSPASGEACLRAAGAVCAAVDAVATGEARNAFCAVRPPGHHAAAGSSMGFCIFNNVAVGVAHARVVHGFERIAVVDFDVHHGNGTQAIFRHDPATFFASIHQSMIFPNSGASGDVGVGNMVNVPLVRDTSAAAFQEAFEDKILPAMRAFRPEFVFVSAGFDAHVRDPLGDLRLMTADFSRLTGALMAVAEACCGGRLVSVLEGGYNPEALADACAVHVQTLMTR
jgi:acetoin utilization deacetylase AcuC-like enzyme